MLIPLIFPPRETPYTREAKFASGIFLQSGDLKTAWQTQDPTTSNQEQDMTIYLGIFTAAIAIWLAATFNPSAVYYNWKRSRAIAEDSRK